MRSTVWCAGAQDVSGGAPVAVEGTDLPLWGMEVDVERARADIRVRPAQAGVPVAVVQPSRQLCLADPSVMVMCTALHSRHFPVSCKLWHRVVLVGSGSS